MRPALSLTTLAEPDYTHCCVSLGTDTLAMMSWTEACRLTHYEVRPEWGWREVSMQRPNTCRFDTILYAVDPFQRRPVTIGDVLAEALAVFIATE
jgi:hypothetical protein